MAIKTKTGYLNGIKVGKITIDTTLKTDKKWFNEQNTRTISYIVMHYTGNSKDTAKSNANYYAYSNTRQASAHFFVDDTSIYQGVGLKDRAWHCGAKKYFHPTCRNANSIGIEMCCTVGNYTIGEKAKENAAQLCAYLCTMIGVTSDTVDTYVLRHYDVTHKVCPAQMVNVAGEWTNFKNRVKEILKVDEAKKPDEPVSPVDTPTPANPADTNGFLITPVNYKVCVTANALNVRKYPRTANSPVVTTIHKGEVYTIVGEVRYASSLWGKLKSGAGYISLSYAKKI